MSDKQAFSMHEQLEQHALSLTSEHEGIKLTYAEAMQLIREYKERLQP